MDEIWKDIPGYEGRYIVSTDGRVASLVGRWRKDNGEPKILGGGYTKKGYRNAVLCKGGKGKTYTIHRLVMITFVGPRQQGQEIRHLNGVRDDNRLANLRYGTSKENARDSFLHGTFPCGDRSPNAKLTWEKVQMIRREYKRTAQTASNSIELARRCRVSKSTIQKVVKGQIWIERNRR